MVRAKWPVIDCTCTYIERVCVEWLNFNFGRREGPPADTGAVLWRILIFLRTNVTARGYKKRWYTVYAADNITMKKSVCYEKLSDMIVHRLNYLNLQSWIFCNEMLLLKFNGNYSKFNEFLSTFGRVTKPGFGVSHFFIPAWVGFSGTSSRPPTQRAHPLQLPTRRNTNKYR